MQRVSRVNIDQNKPDISITKAISGYPRLLQDRLTVLNETLIENQFVRASELKKENNFSEAKGVICMVERTTFASTSWSTLYHI
jgi:hypothetical protein